MSWGASALAITPESLRDDILKVTEVIGDRYQEIPEKIAEEHEAGMPFPLD